MKQHSKKYRMKKKLEQARGNINLLCGLYTRWMQEGRISKETWEARMKDLHEVDFLCFEELNK